MIPTLRTLTEKSKLGFGKYKDLTVRQIIEMRMKKNLLSAYYKLTSINFNEEVLKEIGITDEFVIKKPGKDIDVYYKILNHLGYEKKHLNGGANIMKLKTKSFKKGYLQSKNHGK